MTRKIISMKDTFGYNFPQLPQKFLKENKTVNEILIPAGSVDADWEIEKVAVFLINISGRNYYSIPTEMSQEMLDDAITINGYNSPEDYDIITETKLGIEFITELFNRLPHHLNKYIEDNNYLSYLGNLPPAPEFLPVEDEESSTDTSSS